MQLSRSVLRISLSHHHAIKIQVYLNSDDTLALESVFDNLNDGKETFSCNCIFKLLPYFGPFILGKISSDLHKTQFTQDAIYTRRESGHLYIRTGLTFLFRDMSYLKRQHAFCNNRFYVKLASYVSRDLFCVA